MSSPEEKISMAIGVMTAWVNDPHGANREDVANVADLMIGDSGTVVDLADGLISLCGWLLWRIEKLGGAPAELTLQDIARRVAQS